MKIENRLRCPRTRIIRNAHVQTFVSNSQRPLGIKLTCIAKIFCNLNFQNKGGGQKPFNDVKKVAIVARGGFPYSDGIKNIKGICFWANIILDGTALRQSRAVGWMG